LRSASHSTYKLINNFHDILLGSQSVLLVAGDGDDVLLWVALLREVDLYIVVLADFGDDCSALANDFGVEVGVNLDLRKHKMER
jgi:hypothetical protein